MLRNILILAVAALLPAATAQGHGFAIALDGNQIVVGGHGPTPDLFATDHLVELTAGEEYSSIHGLFAEDPAPTPPLDSFGPSDTFAIDIVSPLLYSTGGTASPAPTATMEAGNALLDTLSFDGGTVGVTPGFEVSGADTHEVQWGLYDVNGNLGAYGFQYRILGFAGGDVNSPYDPVDVTVVFHTPGTFDQGAAETALYEALNAAASTGLPEPSAAVILAGLLGSLGLLRRRRR